MIICDLKTFVWSLLKVCSELNKKWKVYRVELVRMLAGVHITGSVAYGAAGTRAPHSEPNRTEPGVSSCAPAPIVCSPLPLPLPATPRGAPQLFSICALPDTWTIPRPPRSPRATTTPAPTMCFHSYDRTIFLRLLTKITRSAVQAVKRTGFANGLFKSMMTGATQDQLATQKEIAEIRPNELDDEFKNFIPSLFSVVWNIWIA